MRMKGFAAYLLAGTAAVALIAGFSAVGSQTGADLGFVSKAVAQGQGKMQGQQGGQGGSGGSGGQAGQGGSGGGKGGPGGVPKAVTADEGDDGDSDKPSWAGQGGGGNPTPGAGDSDSDRPGWAGPNPTEPKPSGMGGGSPDMAGTMKGSIYGDLYDIEWTAAGSPELDADGNLKAVAWVDLDGDGKSDALLSEYLNLAGDPTLLIQWEKDSEGDWVMTNVAYDEANPATTYSGAYTIVPGTVEFGRTSVARAPDRVLQQQINEVESLLLSATNVAIALDGRILVTTAEGESTIDSPLMNLALYAVLMDSDRNIVLSDAASNILTNLGVQPQALLAAAADKTGTITVDYVAYLDTVLGINEVNRDTTTSPPSTTVSYLDLSSYSYTRSDVWSQAVIDAVFGGTNVTAPDGADAFAQSADDYLQVIEFIHDNPGAL